MVEVSSLCERVAVCVPLRMGLVAMIPQPIPKPGKRRKEKRHSDAFRDWVSRLQCLIWCVDKKRFDLMFKPQTHSVCVIHHEPPRGMGGRTGDQDLVNGKGAIVPLCRIHHDQRHNGIPEEIRRIKALCEKHAPEYWKEWNRKGKS